VELCLPRPIDPQVEQALAVRVLDAVRASGKTYGEVNVKVVVADSPASAR
jgi:hypothetical protein